jgi:tetratricopeptide (TPR) repeat protein
MNPKNFKDIAAADDILYALPEDASESALSTAAKKALAITPYCMGAWLVLAQQAETEDEAIIILKNGIDHGRELHADLITSVGSDHGIWGHHEARDFMRLLHELATVCEAHDEIEKAVEIYEEMLRLNPDDNQGIRGDLLHAYIILNLSAEAKVLLKRFENTVDLDTDLVYGAALLEIMIAMEDFDDTWMDEIERQQPSDIAGFKKFFGKNFQAVDKAMKAATKANPYVGLVMSMPGIMEMEEPPTYSIGGPDEALFYSHKHAATWFAAFLPFVMISTYALHANEHGPEPRIEHVEELENISEFATDPDCTPWWEDLME